jgi:Ni,Fe-hydrogenase III large subunit
MSGVAARGARKGRPRGLLGLIARALPPQLDTFVLPGLDVARAAGLDLDAAGCRPATTPRHSTVLLVVGELPTALLEAAVVVFAQMTRPRVIVALESGDISPLPTADVIGQVSQNALETAMEQARQVLSEGSWSAEAEPFEAEGLVPKRRKRKKKSPASPRKSGGNQGSSDGTKSEHQVGMHHDQSGQGGAAEAGTGGEGAGHGGANQGGMKNGMSGGGMEMGFMSMVRLTQHLQRSADGLPMERVQAPFGPFFAGLPSGLDIAFWLDGDTVARVEVATGTASRGLEPTLPGDTDTFVARLARVDPLAPNSYRLLALRALEPEGHLDAEGEAMGRVAAVELERAVSHLNWLASFGYLLGYSWLSGKAGGWQQALNRCHDLASIASLEQRLLAFVERVRRDLLLSSRLRGIGRLVADDLEGVSGPIARASGLEVDARLDDPLYQSLGFEPALRHEGDGRARLTVRLEEIRQSLSLVLAGGRFRSTVTDPAARSTAARAREAGEVKVETPRGTARLRLRTNKMTVTEAKLYTPSAASMKLIEKVTVGLELADALTAVASLDISPWEADL